MIRAVLVVLFLVPYALLASLLGYPIARCLGSPRLLYRLGHLGIRTAFRLAGTRIVVEGRERLTDCQNAIVMANHATHLDAPALFAGLGIDFRVVAKAELFRFPLISRCLRYAGFVEVNRREHTKAVRALSRAAEALRAGACLLVFPEGSRTRTGELGPFKKGAFVLAIDAGSRVVPVALAGAHDLMPRGSFRIRPGTIRIQVLDSVEAQGYSYEQRDVLIDTVRDRIAEAMRPAGRGREERQ